MGSIPIIRFSDSCIIFRVLFVVHESVNFSNKTTTMENWTILGETLFEGDLDNEKYTTSVFAKNETCSVSLYQITEKRVIFKIHLEKGGYSLDEKPKKYVYDIYPIFNKSNYTWINPIQCNASANLYVSAIRHSLYVAFVLKNDEKLVETMKKFIDGLTNGKKYNIFMKMEKKPLTNEEKCDTIPSSTETTGKDEQI